jgi:putative YphP/YqiW family bacilliredoxin
MYPEELVVSIEAELTQAGFAPLKTARQVTDHFTNQQGTTLLVINSMCGCAGPDARMGIVAALANTTHRPDYLVTVFPGVDEEATAQLQQYIKPYPLSTPAIVLLKEGEVVYFMERYQIKGEPAESIADNLLAALARYC